MPRPVAGDPSVASQVATPEGPPSLHSQRAGEKVPCGTTMPAGSVSEIDGGVRSMLTVTDLWASALPVTSRAKYVTVVVPSAVTISEAEAPATVVGAVVWAPLAA